MAMLFSPRAPRSIEARPMGLSAEPDAADGADPLEAYERLTGYPLELS